ncbi:MAG TPA: endonuclease/exonuclease/phosphatase family protein [Pirellulales bacterium]|jgi:endonuclease/exonuclease/phosphatase (EEP) superfamily protein YafD|nr:endonuclease/exonuclease/phosphatase family protein [Pirellulales bacterium]
MEENVFLSKAATAEPRLTDRPQTWRGHLAKYLACAALAMSALLCLFIALCYTWRLDAWTVVTVFPIWVWWLAGIVLVAAARRRVGRRYSLTVVLLWGLVLCCFADHPLSLLRLKTRGGSPTLRIISLNAAGSARAVREVAALRPDVVLVQESPGREPLVALAQECFGDEGHVRSGVDASIVARGEIAPLPLPESVSANAASARVRLTDGTEINVASLRLDTPSVRIDLWSPDCWREKVATRQRQRKQLETIMDAVRASSGGLPFVVGGDFNAPPGDAVFQTLAPLHDAFGEAGRGWGNTILNAAPFLRIDQIWLPPEFRAVDVYSQKTEHSDHRMVVCDIQVQTPGRALR